MEIENKEIQETIQQENKEEDFLYLLDGFTLSQSYLIKGCQRPHKLYLHHYCLENIPQISKPTEINVLDIFNSNLLQSETKEIKENDDKEEDKILSPFKTRGIILLKLNSICRGNSPVQKETILLLQKLYEEDILPIIPTMTKRSPCGNTYHISAVGKVLMGEGEVLYNNERKATKEVFEQLNITPIQFQDPEYKIFIEGNEMNTVSIVDGYDKITKYLQALAVGVSLAIVSKGKMGKSLETHFFRQFTTKGMSRLTNLIKNFFTRTKEEEEKKEENKNKEETPIEIKPIETDPIVIDVVCSFGRIFEIILFIHELLPMELNGTRDQYYVVQKKEEIGISEPSWGIGSFSGVIAREIIGIAKDLQCLCKRYSSLVSNQENENEMKKEDENISLQMNVNQSPYEIALNQMKYQLHEVCEMISQFYIQLKQVSFGETFENEFIPQLIEKIKSIEDDKFIHAIKFGELKSIIKSLHFDF